jgi:hypothetical protein
MGTKQESEYIVSLKFTATGREWLGLKCGPSKQYQGAADIGQLKHAQVGDFVQIEGIAGVWAVFHRTWKLMADQTELWIELEGPIAEDE